MTLSLKKYVSTYTNSTTNRGVSAKEIEIANTRLDMNSTGQTESGNEIVGDHGERTIMEAETSLQIDSPHIETDETASFIQVVVQKHHKKRESLSAAAQTSPRLPTASSPLIKMQKAPMQGPCGDGKEPGLESAPVFVVPHPMMLTYTVPPQHSQYNAQNPYIWRTLEARRGTAATTATGYTTATAATGDTATSARSSTSFKKLVRAARCDRKKKNISRPSTEEQEASAPKYKSSFWKKMGSVNEESFSKHIPERVEVYYFEVGSGADSHLCTTDGPRAARAELWCARAERLAVRALAELLAAPQCLAMLPVHCLLQLFRVACVVARGVTAGTLQVAGDYLVKPLLASVYNALLHPPLVCAAHALQAAGAALAPAGAALAALCTLRLQVHHV